MADKKATRSVSEIEADMAATRDRLSRTVDELTVRVSPAEIKRRQVESLKGKVNRATHDEAGAPRYDTLAKGLAGVAGTALTLGTLRRIFYRG